MFLISAAQEIDVEQEVVVATLDSVLRVRGGERAFAEQAGVTPIYISYIRGRRSVPRLRTAKRIAEALPLSKQEREAWLFHVEQIWALKRNARRQVDSIVRDQSVEALVNEIRQAHGTATFARDPEIARAHYRQVDIAAGSLIRAVNPNRDPIHYIELCMLNHDALCILNRNYEAFWYAKRAKLISENINDPREYQTTQERLDFFKVNAIRSEAVSYHNMKLYREAHQKCQEVEASQALQRNAAFWKPHLYRDALNALEGIPRFSITEAENQYDQVRSIFETRTDEFDQFLFFLISQSLARAYIQHGNLKDAQRVLTPQFERMSKIAQLGQLHQVIFLRTFARLHLAQGDTGDDFKYLIRESTRIATQAGLDHQLNEIHSEFARV
ncbi:MAG: helix-turn-helix transcriptional regulator [Chloroflexi bacterium]|nr:helix-turn-helix transcriptional regulator [Chloroflexota bacterium]